MMLPRVLDASEPDLVFYLAGADPYEGDRLGKLARIELFEDRLPVGDRLIEVAVPGRSSPATGVQGRA